LPDEPGVSPRSNSERPSRQISSRSFVSVMATPADLALSHALAARPSRDTQRPKPPIHFGSQQKRGIAACQNPPTQSRASP
jgi:hypothetical protein